MKEKVLELVRKLLADIESLEDDSSAQIEALKAQVADLQSKLDADEAKIAKAKEDLA